MISVDNKIQYHPLIQDNIIVIEHLRKDRFKPKDKYEYSEASETVIANLLEKPFNLTAQGITKGYDTSKDFDLCSNVTNKVRSVELKITGKDDLYIEYAYEDGTPSGISISKSNLYVILSGGWSGQGRFAKHVGKLRMFKTHQLRDIIETLKTMPEYCKDFPSYDGGRGSKCILLTKELIKTYNIDIGLMDIGLVKKNGKIIGYDLNDLNACGNLGYAQSRVWKYFT